MPDTAVLPAPTPPLRETYTLRRDRCVVELSLRFLRCPLLRGRFTATGGHLTLGEEPGATVVLDAASLRIGFPLLARILTGPTGLDAGHHPGLTFATRHLAFDDDRSFELTGSLEVAGAGSGLRLRGDLRHVDEERIILWAAGTRLPPRRAPRGTGRIARFFAQRRTHVEVAIEFVR